MLNVETDLEQLEQYLDDALPADAMAGVQARLRDDTQLSSALDTLRAERALRAAAWQSMEPDAATTDRLMWRVRGAMLQQNQQAQPTVVTPRFWNQWRLTGVGSAAAACLVLGFAFGRIDSRHNPVSKPSSSHVDVATNNQPMLIPDEVQPATDRNTVAASNVTAGNTVPIADEYGHIIAVQKFATPEEARKFAEVLHRTRPTGSTAPVGPIKSAADEQVPF